MFLTIWGRSRGERHAFSATGKKWVLRALDANLISQNIVIFLAKEEN